MANIQSRAPTIEDVSKAGKQFLRLAAVEFSLRLFVLTRLTDLSLPEPGPPIWAQENGGSRILREHLNRCGLTRDELARRLGGHHIHLSTISWTERTIPATHMSRPWPLPWRHRGVNRPS